MRRKPDTQVSGQAAVGIGNDNHGLIITGPVTLKQEESNTRTGPARLLPPGLPDFTGRQSEIEEIELGNRSKNVMATIITGKPGVGKTSLALHVAYKFYSEYKDGAFYADLRGIEKDPTPPHEILGRLLSGVGIPEEEIPADVDRRLDRYRQEFSGLRVVIILDNAGSESQVRPLIPPGGEALVLITSRFQLNGLEAVRQLSLDVFDEESSISFLRKVVGDSALEESITSAREVGTLCGHLPLALRIAANRLRMIQMSDLAEELRDQQNRLGALEIGDLAIRAAFNLSFRKLGKNKRNSLKRLSCVPDVDFGSGICGALDDSDEQSAARTLRKLAEANLIEASGRPGRYRFHDLIKVYVRGKFEQDSYKKREAATKRMLDWVSYSALKANMILTGQIENIQFPATRMAKMDSVEDAATWMDQEGRNATSAIPLLIQANDPDKAKSLAVQLCFAYELLGDWQAWEDVISHGIRLAKQFPSSFYELTILGAKVNLLRYRRDFDSALSLAESIYPKALSTKNKMLIANTTNLLGCLRMDVGDNDGALPLLMECLSLNEDIGLRHEIGKILYNLGTVHRSSGRFHEAIKNFEQDLEVCLEAKDASGAAETMNTLALTFIDIGEFAKAEKYQRDSLRIFQSLGNPHKVSMVCNDLAVCLRQQGRIEEALELHLEDVERSRQCGNLSGEALAKANAAVLLMVIDENEEADSLFKEAISIFDALGDRVRLARTVVGQIPLLFQVNQGDLAADEANKAIAILLQRGEIKDVVHAHASLALEFNKRGDNPSALPHVEEALRITEEFKSPIFRATACLMATVVFSDLEQSDPARKYVKEFASIVNERPELAVYFAEHYPVLVQKGYPEMNDLSSRMKRND